MIGAPPVRRRMLGAALRRYREELGYSLEAAAQVLGCDRSKVSRIETGHRGIRLPELEELLEEYGADETERRALSVIADPRGARGWWQQYSDVLPEAYRDYLSLEAAASRIGVYETHRVPGLLQTVQYAQAITDADPVIPVGLRGRALQAAVIHQRGILAQGRPEVAVVIGEGVLHQAVGGEPVMRGQLLRLAAASQDRAQVTIRILPFEAGAHAAAGTGPMTILGFASTPGLGVVHLASLPSGVFLDDQEDVACYERMFLELQASALSPGESARLLQEMAVGWVSGSFQPGPFGHISSRVGKSCLVMPGDV
jgi:transcriptional regulator with XRE-family HTH domain